MDRTSCLPWLRERETSAWGVTFVFWRATAGASLGSFFPKMRVPKIAELFTMQCTRTILVLSATLRVSTSFGCRRTPCPAARSGSTRSRSLHCHRRATECGESRSQRPSASHCRSEPLRPAARSRQRATCSARKAMIDYRTRSRESVFLRDARDVIGFRVQKVRAGIYVNPPTRRMLDWDQCIASIINGICTHLTWPLTAI